MFLNILSFPQLISRKKNIFHNNLFFRFEINWVIFHISQNQAVLQAVKWLMKSPVKKNSRAISGYGILRDSSIKIKFYSLNILTVNSMRWICLSIKAKLLVQLWSPTMLGFGIGFYKVNQ